MLRLVKLMDQPPNIHRRLLADLFVVFIEPASGGGPAHIPHVTQELPIRIELAGGVQRLESLRVGNHMNECP